MSGPRWIIIQLSIPNTPLQGGTPESDPYLEQDPQYDANGGAYPAESQAYNDDFHIMVNPPQDDGYYGNDAGANYGYNEAQNGQQAGYDDWGYGYGYGGYDSTGGEPQLS